MAAGWRSARATERDFRLGLRGRCDTAPLLRAPGLCFGLGLVLTMVSADVLAALSVKHIASRWSGFSNFARQAPYASAALIVLIGLYTGWLGWQGVEHGSHAAAIIGRSAG